MALCRTSQVCRLTDHTLSDILGTWKREQMPWDSVDKHRDEDYTERRKNSRRRFKLGGRRSTDNRSERRMGFLGLRDPVRDEDTSPQRFKMQVERSDGSKSEVFSYPSKQHRDNRARAVAKFSAVVVVRTWEES